MDDALHMHAANYAAASWGARYERLRMMRVGWWHSTSPAALAAISPQPGIAWGTSNARGRGNDNFESLQGESGI